MSHSAIRTRRGSARWAAALVAIFVATAALPGVAAAAPGSPSGASQPAEMEALEGFRMTAVMLGLVAGIIPQPVVSKHAATPPPAFSVLEIERRVWAGEEGLPGLPNPY